MEGVRGMRILIDFGGTITSFGSTDVDPASAEIVRTLVAEGNEVLICSNSSPKADAVAELGATWLQIDALKPKVGKVLSDLAAKQDKPLIIIGDSPYYDAVLASRLKVPFLLVKRLGDRGISSFEKIMSGLSAVKNRKPAVFIDPQADTITLLTKDPQGKESEKHSKETSEIVRQLAEGMKVAGASVLVDPKVSDISSVVCIIGSLVALEYVAKEQKKGFVKKIIVGPELGATPEQARAAIETKNIDAVVFPSPWLKALWSSIDQYFNSADVVSLGVPETGQVSTREPKAEFIVYANDVPEALFHDIIAVLWRHNLSIVVSRDGTFTDRQYHEALKRAQGVIYLASADPTGLPLKTAWMANVPTLCWQPGKIVYAGQTLVDATVGAPYLSDFYGASFSSATDFEAALDSFLSNLQRYQPREKAKFECSLANAANQYLAIIRRSKG